MRLTDLLAKYASPPKPVSVIPPVTPTQVDDLPSNPTDWPDDWRYAFIERSGMLMNTGVSQEEADSVAESIIRDQYAEANKTKDVQEVIR